MRQVALVRGQDTQETLVAINLPPHFPHTHTWAHAMGHPDSNHHQFTDRVGLLGAGSHMALGILVGLHQQLDKAGND